MRRYILLISTILAIAGSTTMAIDAQDQVSSTLAQLGLPELKVTMTPDGVEAPDEVSAGRVLLIVDNATDVPAWIAPIKLADGDSMEGIIASATPGTEDGSGVLPTLTGATWAGGDYAMPGNTSSGLIITLTPGVWHLYDPSNVSKLPASFTVTGDGSTITDDIPDTAATIEMVDFQFELPERIEAGDQVWKVTNSGEQLHDIHVVRVPEGTTPDDLMAVLNTEGEATPNSGALSPDEIVPQFGIGTFQRSKRLEGHLHRAWDLRHGDMGE